MESLHPSEIDLGLERIRVVARRLDLLALPGKVVTVAGTNGKGSFVCALAALLRTAGYSVACYSSPHLERYNERIDINGQLASDKQIIEAFTAIDRARGSTSLTYFEFGTLAAFYLFKQAQVDVCLLEVGLGGRLDAVNIIDSDIAVLSSVGIDHEAWLGSDRESIGREKAGILRAKRNFICVDNEPPASVQAIASQLQCPSFYIGEHFNWRYDGCELELNLALEGRQQKLRLSASSLPAPSLLAALKAFDLLGAKLNREKIESVLQNVSLAGRFERLDVGGTELILDVAHNAQASALLAKRLRLQGYRDLTVLFTAMQDKQLDAIVEPLAPLVKQWVCTEIETLPRCRRAEHIAVALESMGVSVQLQADIHLALAQALDQARGSQQPLLVLGSFFIVGAVKSLIHSEYSDE